MNCRMIHGLHIKDGKATYVSRFVRTSRLKQEEYFGGSKFMKVWKESEKYTNRKQILVLYFLYVISRLEISRVYLEF